MKPDSKYRKTQAGEEAVRRRQISQRNLRSVLIMIDGNTTVQEIASRFGDIESVSGLIMELVHRGLVQDVDPTRHGIVLKPLRETAVASMVEQASAAEVDSVVEEVPEFTVTDTGGEDPDGFAPTLIEIDDDDNFDDMPAMPQIPVRKFSIEDAYGPGAKPFSSADQDEQVPRDQTFGASNNKAESGANWWGRFRQQVSARAHSIQWQRERSPSFAGDSVMPDHQADMQASAASRVQESLTGMLSPARIVVVALCALVAWISYSIVRPHDADKVQLENTLSALLGKRVSIENVAWSAVPYPALVASHVTLPDVPSVAIREIRLVPSLGYLMGGEPSAYRVEVVNPTVSALSLQAFSGPLGQLSPGSVIITGAAIDVAGLRSEGWSGTARVQEGKSLVELALIQSGGQSLTLQQEEAGWKLKGTLLNWRTSDKPQLVADILEFEATQRAGLVHFANLQGKLFDGLFAGSGDYRLDDTRFNGKIKLTRVDASKLLQALSTTPRLEGDLSGDFDVQIPVDQWIVDNQKFQLSGLVQVSRGNLTAVDWAQAMRNPVKSGNRGGTTAMDNLTLQLKCNGAEADRLNDLGMQCRYDNIVLAAGPLSVTGAYDVSSQGKLSGQFVAVMRSSAVTVKAPMRMEGTGKEPVLVTGTLARAR